MFRIPDLGFRVKGFGFKGWSAGDFGASRLHLAIASAGVRCRESHTLVEIIHWLLDDPPTL